MMPYRYFSLFFFTYNKFNEQGFRHYCDWNKWFQSLTLNNYILKSWYKIIYNMKIFDSKNTTIINKNILKHMAYSGIILHVKVIEYLKVWRLKMKEFRVYLKATKKFAIKKTKQVKRKIKWSQLSDETLKWNKNF